MPKWGGYSSVLSSQRGKIRFLHRRRSVSKDLFSAFVLDGPRDTNLNLAASDVSGQKGFYQIGDTGLSTLDGGTASRHATLGYTSSVYTVQCDTLEQICRTSVQGDIHCLKVDVEGAEAAVLRGADFSAYRPWIVLVEATEPLSDVPTQHLWEPVLLENGYDFVLFDGLNRFYVAHEHSELKLALSFRADDYERASAFWTRGHYERMARELAQKMDAARAILTYSDLADTGLKPGSVE